MASLNPADVAIRPATDKDDDFLRRVHHAARHWEFAILLETGQAELYHKILAHQYKTQHEVYFAAYPKAHYGIIQLSNRAVGRLYVDYREGEVRVLDIAILPEYRSAGIGEVVMRGICIEAGMRRTPVRLHTHQMSRALAFYQKLGFRQIGTEGPSYLMEWSHPDPDALLRGHFLPPSAAIAVTPPPNTSQQPSSGASLLERSRS